MIKIGKRRAIMPTAKVWKKAEETAYICQMATYFEDTQLTRLFLTEASINTIQQWAVSGSGGKAGKSNEAIFEKGGLLLGSYRMDGQTIDTLIHTFMPIEEVEEQTNIIWKVGKGIAKVAAKACLEHPDLLVVGWLHTHPGHGPYLSTTDLEQTQVFFPHPYQVAIVIDPLSKTMETGIYTRQASEQMNNVTDQKEYLNWNQLTRHFTL